MKASKVNETHTNHNNRSPAVGGVWESRSRKRVKQTQIPLVFLILVSVGVALPTFAETRPNILFIAVDDLNDWVGHLGGHPQARTPNIDRLARAGVSFAKAYCSAPLCNPSRVSLLTGIEPSKSGVYGNGERFREKLPRAVTLMQYFRGTCQGKCGLVNPHARKKGLSWGFSSSEIAQLTTFASSMSPSSLSSGPQGAQAKAGRSAGRLYLALVRGALK